MDNDIKIEKSKKNNQKKNQELVEKKIVPEQEIHKDVRLFLDNELEFLRKKDSELQAYNLENEYEKTRKHKSPLALIILGICFLVVLSTVIIMTAVINEKDKNITVEMTVFDDLNLKSLLDTVSKVQASYDSAVKNRSTLINDKEVALRAAESKREQESFVVKSTGFSAKTERDKLALIQKDYEKTVNEINDEYDPKIKTLEIEIADYENRLKDFDASKIQAAQEQERLINSERRVQELERRKLTQQYEDRISELEQTIETLRSKSSEDMYRSVTSLSSKYQTEINGLDPKLNDYDAEVIIADTVVNKTENFDSSEILEQLTDETAIMAFEKYQTVYNNYSYIDGFISALPQKNSIPDYVAASRSLVNEMGKTFSETTVALNNDKLLLSEQVDDLTSEVEGLEGEVDGLEGEIYGLEKQVVILEEQVDNLDNEVNSLYDDYNNLIDEYNDLVDVITEKDADIESLEQKNIDEINAAAEQKKFFQTMLNGVITSSKAMAAVAKAEKKDNIRVYVTPEVSKQIGNQEIPAEIKASKSIKGSIVKDGDEYYKFIPAKDKTGSFVDFDLSSVKPGVIVKLTIKK